MKQENKDRQPKCAIYSVEDMATEVSNWGQAVNDEEVLCWLRLKGYLLAQPGPEYNYPTEPCVYLGLMVQERSYRNLAGGRTIIELRPCFTEKGHDFLLPRLVDYFVHSRDRQKQTTKNNGPETK